MLRVLTFFVLFYAQALLAENLCKDLSNETNSKKPSNLKNAQIDAKNKRSPTQEEPRWKLIWSDEFDRDGKVDPKKWNHFTSEVTVNEEKQAYMDAEHSTAFVKDGILYIEGREQKFKDKNYISTRLDSADQWTYGRYEFRAKNPVGKGTWPAIWMLPRKVVYGKVLWLSNGEIDIMETTGRDRNLITNAVFSENDNFWSGRKKIEKTHVAGADSEFHEYALEWLPGRMEFFMDGKSVYSTRKLPGETWKSWPFDQDFHLIINLALGGTLGGPIDPGALPARLAVDYIRVYKPTRAEDCAEWLPTP